MTTHDHPHDNTWLSPWLHMIITPLIVTITMLIALNNTSISRQRCCFTYWRLTWFHTNPNTLPWRPCNVPYVLPNTSRNKVWSPVPSKIWNSSGHSTWNKILELITPLTPPSVTPPSSPSPLPPSLHHPSLHHSITLPSITPSPPTPSPITPSPLLHHSPHHKQTWLGLPNKIPHSIRKE